MRSIRVLVTGEANHGAWAALAVALMGCSPSLPKVAGSAPTSADADAPWTTRPSLSTLAPPPDAAAEQGVEPREISRPSSTLSLPEAADLALRNDSRTRAIWMRARAAAADLGASRASYYPRVDVGVTGSYLHQAALGGRPSWTQGAVGPYVKLSYLLLDFGARSSQSDAELATLLGANWTHHAAIQDQYLSVADAYYRLVSAQALQEAAAADLESAQASLASSRARLGAGTTDLGDVLQAETALSRARIALRGAQGQVDVLRGQLADRLGLRPGSPLDVNPLPDTLDARRSTEAVSHVLERALQSRPDLLAARATAAAAWQRARTAKRRGHPTLTLDANANRAYYVPQNNDVYGDNWGASLTFNVPLFNGWADSYEEQRGAWEALAAEADAETIERRVALEVWTAYQQMQTTAEQLEEAHTLRSTAEKWEELARGRYDSGVGTILDLMSAQSALASARARFVQARADWLLAMVRLTHDAGELGRRSLQQLEPRAAPGNANKPSGPAPNAR